MGRFWEAATIGAGREFGARHYRWFVGARILRAVLPALSMIALIAAAVGGAVWLYRSIHPNWTAIGDRATGWAGNLGGLLLWAIGIVLALIAIGIVVAVLRRNWWRWWTLSRPMWTRRY